MAACPAERYDFKAANNRILSTHIKQCKKAAAGFALVARQLEQDEADQWQTKQHQVSSLKHLEMVPESEVPMDVDLEVKAMGNSPIRMGVNLVQILHCTRCIPLYQHSNITPSCYGNTHQLPSRYQGMQINSHEIGHFSPTSKASRYGDNQKKRRKQSDIENIPPTP